MHFSSSGQQSNLTNCGTSKVYIILLEFSSNGRDKYASLFRMRFLHESVVMTLCRFYKYEENKSSSIQLASFQNDESRLVLTRHI